MAQHSIHHTLLPSLQVYDVLVDMVSDGSHQLLLLNFGAVGTQPLVIPPALPVHPGVDIGIGLAAKASPALCTDNEAAERIPGTISA